MTCLLDPDVTAVLCGNDDQALGVIRAAHDLGLRIPEDVSVVGFDDVPAAPYYTPALTTVRFDFAALGRRAFELLELGSGSTQEKAPLATPSPDRPREHRSRPTRACRCSDDTTTAAPSRRRRRSRTTTQGRPMKRLHKTLIALAAVGLLTTACSDPGGGSDDSGTKSTSAWPAETAKLDGVNLTIWAAQNSNAVAKQVVADFEQKTGAKVKVVTIPDPYEQGVQTKVATGDKPDLAFWQPTASQLTAINAKTNLQPLDGAPWLDKLQPGPQGHHRHPRQDPLRRARDQPGGRRASTTTRRSSPRTASPRRRRTSTR